MNKKKYDVVGLGACGVDLRVRTAKLPTENNKVTAGKVESYGGGVTANNLVQSSKLGLKTKWIGALGNDDLAKGLMLEFKKEKVEAKPLKFEDVSTQQCWIITDTRGEWNIIGIPGATRKITAKDVRDNFSEIIANAKHLHVEVAAVPLEVSLEGAKIAKKNDVKVLLDVDDDPWYLIEKEKLGTKKQFLELLKKVDVVKISNTGALGLTKQKKFSKEIIGKILSYGPQMAVVTLADKGCCIGTENEIIYSKGFPVKVKDTVGAGDAFMGGLSYGLIQDWPLEKVGEFANACGAFKCTQFGTRESGSLNQINKFIK